jgi:hypothetical protein
VHATLRSATRFFVEDRQLDKKRRAQSKKIDLDVNAVKLDKSKNAERDKFRKRPAGLGHSI